MGMTMYLAKYKLDGQTAFITGGGRGIGLASAEALLEAGASVIISDHDASILESGKAALREKGHEVERRGRPMPSAPSTSWSPMPASPGRTRLARRWPTTSG
jgi:NAD(P)-dependent dehydrogenase (short-subunit alcohol dehydrogenase family)